MKGPADLLTRLLLGSPEKRQRDKERAERWANKVVDGLVKIGDEVIGPIEREIKRAQREQEFAKAVLPVFIYDRFTRSMNEEELKKYIEERKHYLIARGQDIEVLVKTGFDVPQAVEQAKAQDLVTSTEGIDLPKLQVKVNHAIEALYQDLIAARVLLGKESPEQAQAQNSKEQLIEELETIYQRTEDVEAHKEYARRRFISRLGPEKGEQAYKEYERRLFDRGLTKDEEF